MSKLIDLTNIKFNKLTVIELSGYDKRGESLWNCICECGNEITVLSSNLRTGHTKSCGCISRLNLLGKTFGRLTVIEDAGFNKKGKTQWKCQCECGNVRIFTTQSLNSGSRRCGKCIDTKYKIEGNITIGITATGEDFIIDTIDLVKVQNYNWYISSAGYVVRKLKGSKNKSVWMHREIINALPSTIVDHINRDKKDNRLSNLRTCNQQQNMTNVGLINTNTTGYKGVSQTRNGRYRAYTDYKNKRYHLGTLDTKEEAALLRDKIVEMLNGEFAWLNFKEI